MVITKGYLLSREDYDLFDEIITFINTYGLVFKCFSVGSRKISSKNARNLNYGDYLEFEFFYSPNKLSRLKKVTTISHINEEYKNRWSLSLINELYLQIKINNKKYFEIYQNVIDMLLNNMNDYYIMIYICLNIIKMLNLPINIDNPEYSDYLWTYKFNQKQNVHHLCDNIKLVLKKIINNEDVVQKDIDLFNLSELKFIVRQLISLIIDKTNIYIACLTWI